MIADLGTGCYPRPVESSPPVSSMPGRHAILMVADGCQGRPVTGDPVRANHLRFAGFSATQADRAPAPADLGLLPGHGSFACAKTSRTRSCGADGTRQPWRTCGRPSATGIARPLNHAPQTDPLPNTRLPQKGGGCCRVASVRLLNWEMRSTGAPVAREPRQPVPVRRPIHRFAATDKCAASIRA
jgi:hypothetical protein